MNTINNKICPKYNGKKLVDTGKKVNNGGDMGQNGSYEISTIPIFECIDCGEIFKIQ
ncbi:hypothetical protein KAJ61_02640 [Candidatus Parcubacteria bacterium]|nr:hypothetical protein [Candidatus Parcubacteria bacterium]